MQRLLAITAVLFALSGTHALAADITAFLGTFTGTAQMSDDGSEADRDMSVTISEAENGFTVAWTSTIRKLDGRIKENKYTITFTPSQRDNIFASAMKTNVFGKAVPLDPLKGDPYVWARLTGNTLSVFSLLIDEDGNYMVQEYHRSLTDGGLNLEYKRFRDGAALKTVNAFLAKS